MCPFALTLLPQQILQQECFPWHNHPSSQPSHFNFIFQVKTSSKSLPDFIIQKWSQPSIYFQKQLIITFSWLRWLYVIQSAKVRGDCQSLWGHTRKQEYSWQSRKYGCLTCSLYFSFDQMCVLSHFKKVSSLLGWEKQKYLYVSIQSTLSRHSLSRQKFCCSHESWKLRQLAYWR